MKSNFACLPCGRRGAAKAGSDAAKRLVKESISDPIELQPPRDLPYPGSGPSRVLACDARGGLLVESVNPDLVAVQSSRDLTFSGSGSSWNSAADSEELDGVSSSTSEVCEGGASSKQCLSQGGTEQEDSSVMAALHAAGRCKPCAWHWKPSGCANVENCKFCHLCGPGELRKRSQDRGAPPRVQDREKGAAQATGAPNELDLSSFDMSSVTPSTYSGTGSSRSSRHTPVLKKGQVDQERAAPTPSPPTRASVAKGKPMLKVSL
mmetsp:Transcript_58680/g.162271  ORF Transcript_58680/g.162271 Transcript_58680/m.162271 type:complete len:264 (-) Transcript_58680:322-1113(-)